MNTNDETTDLRNLDLSVPGPRAKKAKKDHRCPHDRKNPTGMEVCRECGDFGICKTCGAEYIRRDVYWRHETLCWPCACLDSALLHIDRMRAEQQKRIAEHKKEATE